jgi:hypothetical protein
MAASASESRVHISLDLESGRAAEFLDKLAHDDDFRDRLSERPDEVMAEYGISIEGIPTSEVELPPKDLVQELHSRASGVAATRGRGKINPWFVLTAVGMATSSSKTE